MNEKTCVSTRAVVFSIMKFEKQQIASAFAAQIPNLFHTTVRLLVVSKQELSKQFVSFRQLTLNRRQEIFSARK